MYRFLNKIVIVTGGASGIGKETVKQFCNEGATVIIADINIKDGLALQEELSISDQKIHFLKTDVSSLAEVEALMEYVQHHFQQIDVLVNNAGIEISGALIDFTESQYDKLFNTNVKSVFLCSKHALKYMIQQNAGCIINLASVASFLAWPDDAIYSASKAAVMMLTKALALEYAKYNIRVNAVAPGIIDTPMTDRALENYANLTEAKKMKGKTHPLGRLGTPEEVAKSILFLCSTDASFITGAILNIDGGFLCG